MIRKVVLGDDRTVELTGPERVKKRLARDTILLVVRADTPSVDKRFDDVLITQVVAGVRVGTLGNTERLASSDILVEVLQQ